MDTSTYLNNIYEKFEKDSFKLNEDKIGSFDVTIANKKQFKCHGLLHR
jgi:hypothetical protein